MKEVIDNSNTSIPLVRLTDINDRKVYLAIGKENPNVKWILRHEPELHGSYGSGWIFRYLDSASGMSGHFPTAKEAIRGAFFYGNVYEFENYEEMVNFLYPIINQKP